MKTFINMYTYLILEETKRFGGRTKMVSYETKFVVFKNGYMMVNKNNEPYVFNNEEEVEAFKKGYESAKHRENPY
jgi:hypothetical protein